MGRARGIARGSANTHAQTILSSPSGGNSIDESTRAARRDKSSLKLKMAESDREDDTPRSGEGIQLNQKTLDAIISGVAAKLKDSGATIGKKKPGEPNTSTGEPKRGAGGKLSTSLKSRPALLHPCGCELRREEKKKKKQRESGPELSTENNPHRIARSSCGIAQGAEGPRAASNTVTTSRP